MYIQFSPSKIVAFYRYRTALVFGFIVSDVDENTLRAVRRVLKRNGYEMDNHICWTTEDGLSYMWSDGRLTVGTRLIVRNW